MSFGADGYVVEDNNDPFVADAERAGWVFSQALEPGRWLVDVFPIR